MSQPDGELGIHKRLDREWFARTSDERFDLLALLGSSGLPVAIGMLVDGHIIRGTVGPDQVFVDAAEAAVERAARSAYADWSTEELAPILEALRQQEDAFRKRKKEARETFDHYFEQYEDGFSLDDIQLADVADMSRATSKTATVTFTQATLQIPGQPAIAVSAMQIARNSIAAWWLLDEEAGLQVNYSGATE